MAGDLTREADLGRRSPLILGGAVAAVLPFVLFAGVLTYTDVNFDAPPGQIPIHWGLDGPDRWAARTPRNVSGLPMCLVFECLAFSVAVFGIARGMRRIHAGGALAEAELRYRSLSILSLLALQYALLVPAVLPFASSDEYRLAGRLMLYRGAGCCAGGLRPITHG